MKLMIFWIVGCIFVMLSFWMASGAFDMARFNPTGTFMSIFGSFVLLLAGSLAWIYVASRARKRR
jgi:hypothetical protein